MNPAVCKNAEIDPETRCRDPIPISIRRMCELRSPRLSVPPCSGLCDFGLRTSDSRLATRNSQLRPSSPEALRKCRFSGIRTWPAPSNTDGLRKAAAPADIEVRGNGYSSKQKDTDARAPERKDGGATRMSQLPPLPTGFRYSPAIPYEPGVTRRDPSPVIRIGSLYHVWYTYATRDPSGYFGEIRHAASPDGRRWSEHDTALRPGPAGAWDSNGVSRPPPSSPEGVSTCSTPRFRRRSTTTEAAPAAPRQPSGLPQRTRRTARGESTAAIPY